MSNDLEAARRSISSTLNEINATRAKLGIPGIDDDDRMEALDMIARIERKIRANAKETAA
ncbi:hypothetical protein ACVWZ4_000016 [Bradyrhizobium sp. USDA 4472]